jgi:DNA-binding transcriptional ArsR family regulator
VSALEGSPNIAYIARALADPTRCTIVGALAGGETRPSGELARIAGVGRSTASEHLGYLADAGLVRVHARGKHRFYELASAEVCQALEALAVVSPRKPLRSLHESSAMSKLVFARSCYDHLAGRLGVELRDALERRQYVTASEGRSVELTPAGRAVFVAVGVTFPTETKRSRRPALRECLDWTERRPHLAGSVAAALLSALLEQQALVRRPEGRGLALGPNSSLLRRLGVSLPDEL